jgi:preprotein translocase subunit SecY
MPGIDREAFKQFIDQGGQLIGFLDIFTGGGISTLGIFALGILPFINASIILQLLTAALPQLEDLQKNEGEAGRRKIAQITRYVALGWGLIQSVVFRNDFAPIRRRGVKRSCLCRSNGLSPRHGSMIVMWIAEVITERGIGQGASLVIFLNIVATLPRTLGATIEAAQTGDRDTVLGIVVLVLVFLATIVGIIFVQEGAPSYSDCECQAPSRWSWCSTNASELLTAQAECRWGDANHFCFGIDFLARHRRESHQE